ncbi:hypothetical protein SAMN05421820_107398 [Pedobacter steynii]|uniref:Copper-binding protein MbnP-like domain-containing protein n=1 Tax=Pedobacter steynii TaxID=430522 RepID=A0A1H0BFP4_9SPHI|nr:MbnP family protein [Pedobacter steynii]NQX41067.1 hypothetical protein [Pedobacter steynii]SDN44442.1 hypothetical protein SAMN05421820_107398 [Pedobacter steynii]
MKKISTILSLSVLLFTACSKDKDPINAIDANGKTTLSFDAVFGNQDFALNTDFTASGKTYNFNKFRYWISNVVLVGSNGTEFKVPGSYYLLEETGAINLKGVNNDLPTTVYPATKREDVVLKDIPAGDYKSIKFSVGVDPKYNDNLSLLSGELSPLNGMTNVSWMWLTSYIFTSVTGKVTEGPTSKTLKIETGLNANYKTVALDLPKALSINATTSSHLVLNVDVAKALDGLDVMTTPVVGAAQATAMTAVAGNYATKVFSIKSLN